MADKYRNNVLAFKEAVKGKLFFVFDTETTGLSATENDIIEFSAIRIEEKDGVYTENGHLDIYINPGYAIPPEITEITGITDVMLADKPSPEEAARVIRKFLGEHPIVMGYNSVSFDQPFVNSLYSKIAEEFVPQIHLDVLKMAKEKAPKPHKLTNMAALAGVSEGFEFHKAIDDARATFKVFEYFLPMYDEAEPKPDMSAFEVTEVKRWKKSETLDRIYINNNMNASVYYDVARNEWSVGNNLDEAPVIAAVYAYCGVSDDTGLISKIA